MPPAMDDAAEIPANYVLDILGNVLFVQLMRGIVAKIQIRIENVPDINCKRIESFFNQVAAEYTPKIIGTREGAYDDSTDFWQIKLDYRAKTVISSAFPGDFFAEENNLLQRLRESSTREMVALQIQNFFAKVARVRDLYGRNPIDVQQDPKKFYLLVQKDFRKAPISREFVQFIIDTRSVGKSPK